jgi:hypothetical protein
MKQQLGAGQADVIARYNGIVTPLRIMQVPNAGQLQQWFNFKI